MKRCRWGSRSSLQYRRETPNVGNRERMEEVQDVELSRLQVKREKRRKRWSGEERIEEERDACVGRPWTVSIAVAGSIISNAQTPELQTALAGQIARAATIFQVDEVVVYDDLYEASTGHSRSASFLARVLQYLEVPQYLRRSLIPFHPDLKRCGILPPLDAPHHPRAHEWIEYREGIVLPPHQHPDAPPGTRSTRVDVGLSQPVKVRPPLPSACRVTVRLGKERPREDGKLLRGMAVSPDEPRLLRGTYWGYKTRLCRGIVGVFDESTQPGG